MSIRDNHTNQNVYRALASTAIGSNTTTNGDIIDTADYEMGIKFAFFVSAYTDGTFAVTFQEGDASNLSDATSVPSDKVLGGALSLTAATSASARWNARGVLNTKRYVRAVVTSTGVTTGATLSAVAVAAGEYNPQA